MNCGQFRSAFFFECFSGLSFVLFGPEEREGSLSLRLSPRKKLSTLNLAFDKKEGSVIALEKSPVRSGFDSSFDAVKISQFPSARNRMFWRKTSISRFLENCENADRLKLVEEREMKTPPAHAAASERPPTVGRGRHSSSRSCRLHRRVLPRSLTRTSSRLSKRPRRQPLTLSPPGRRVRDRRPDVHPPHHRRGDYPRA